MRYDDETLRKLQLTELHILKDIDRVCRKLNITYFLDSGSVLGALRHGGFIPWDDDIDLGMPRADYDRFVREAPALLGDAYVVSTPETNPHQAALFGKVWLAGTRFATNETIEAGFDQGIFVDILPYDALVADPTRAAKQRKACRMWQSVSYLAHAKSIVVPHGGALGTAEKAACRAAHLVAAHAFRHDSIVARFTEAATLAQREGDPSDELVVMAYANIAPYAVDMMLPPSKVVFEGCEFPAPARPEAYLEALYGDWETLPPVEKRRNHAPVELDFGPYA